MVVLAIYIKTKDKKLKDIALSAFISGMFGLPCFIGDNTMYHLIWTLIALVVAMAAAFIMTMVTYKDDAPKETEKKALVKEAAKGEKSAAPVKGQVKPLAEVQAKPFPVELWAREQLLF